MYKQASQAILDGIDKNISVCYLVGKFKRRLSMKNKTLSNRQVMNIMKKHQKFREVIREHRPDKPLMSDEEFLERFRQICPTSLGVVTGVKVGEIYQLRSEYEMHPPGKKKGYLPKYNDATVRIQMRDGLINKLNEDELQYVFNQRRLAQNWYWLEDVLEIKLGRWPAEKRELTLADVLRWWYPEELDREKKAETAG